MTARGSLKPTQRLTYQHARDEIQTGDLIALRGTRGLFAWLIRIITGSPYTHTGIAIWINGRLLVVETRQGPASLVPVSHYAHDDFDVFRAPLDCKQLALGSREVILNSIGALRAYAWGDIVRVALHELIGVPLPKPAADRLICSSLSEYIYRRLGWQPENLPSIPTPRDLVAAIGMPARLEVRRNG